MIGLQRSLEGFAPPALASRALPCASLLFPGVFSDEEKEALKDAASLPRSIRPNVDLAREGNCCDSLLIIAAGWACRYTITREGARQLPVVLVPGDVGNLDTLAFDRIDYGVRTITASTVVAFPKHRILALCEKYPGISRAFTRLALIENARLTRWTLSLARRSARERLAHLICELSVRLDADDGNKSQFLLPLTQEQIGDALGLTAVHVNRTMQRLRADGLVMTTDRHITVPDVAQLRRTCGFDPTYLHPDQALRSHAAEPPTVTEQENLEHDRQASGSRVFDNSGASR